MMGSLAGLRSYCRVHGLGATTAKILLGCCRRVVGYSRSEEIVSEKSLVEKSRVSLAPKLTIRALDRQDRDLLAAFHADHGVEPNQRARVNRYLEHGYRGFLAFAGDVLIGYLFWVDNTSKAEDRHPHLRIYDIPLEDHDVYAFDFYIAPRHRGGSRALEFFDRAEKSLAEDGYRKAYGMVLKEKKSARWIYSMLGYRPIRTAVGHKFFGLVAVLNGKVFLTKPNMY